jgi:hypothetical protein
LLEVVAGVATVEVLAPWALLVKTVVLPKDMAAVLV